MLSALESATSVSSHSFSIRRKPRFAVATIRLMCSTLSRSIHGCNSAMNCFAARSAAFSSRYFHSRFHFFYDLLPHCFHDNGVLFPVLAGSLFEDRGTRESVFVS